MLLAGLAPVALETAVVLVFAASFVSKVCSRRSWRTYRAAIRFSRALPAALAPPIAILLAAAEALIALMIGWPASRTIGLAVAFVVAAGLALGVGIALARGTEASCACFGAGQRLSTSHLARNLLLTALVGAGCVVAHARHAGGIGWLAGAAGVLLGLAGAALIVGWEEIGWAVSGLRSEQAA